MHRHAAKMAAPLFVVALSGAAAGVARADEVDAAVQRLVSLDQRVHIMSLEFTEGPRVATDVAVRRLVDAQGLIQLGRANAATALLLDIAVRWPDTPAARDANFLLGDALFQLGDVRLARRYYDAALATFSGTRRERAALIRLVEIALRTDDLAHVDRYLALLARVKDTARDPAVRYLDAKLRYRRGQLDDAGQMFSGIATSAPPGSPYAWRARYFAATILLQQGDLDGASRGFEALLPARPTDDVAREIQDLARLALARIAYQQGRFDRAAASYRSIAADSKASPDAHWELGWTYVAAKDFQKARDAFAHLLRAQPQGPRAPELEVLLANLQLRQGQLAEARGAFSKARDALEPSYATLRGVIVRSQADPTFLDQLTNRAHDQLDLAAFVPGSARAWVRADPDVARLLSLANDVVLSQRLVAECGDTIGRVETAVAEAAGQDPLELFIDLRRTRQASSQLFAELALIRDRFTARARRLQAPHLQGDEAARLRELDAERADIVGQLGAPSKLAAAEAERPTSPSLTREPRDAVGLLRALVLRLEGPRSEVGYGVAEALRATSPGVLSAARERAIADRLQRLNNEERQVQDEVTRRLGPDERRRLERELEVASRAGAVASQLFALDARLHAAAEARLTTLKRAVADRRRDVETTTGALGGVVHDTQDLGGVLVRVMYTRIADRLYDLLVRSEVGLVDVAWASKERSVGGLRSVVMKKKAEIKPILDQLDREEDALDRRFKRVTRWLEQMTAEGLLPEQAEQSDNER